LHFKSLAIFTQLKEMDMKRILLSLAFTITGFLAFAQCSIDSTQTDPGIYPDTLLPATVNQPYTQDITFVMITDTMGITITNFNIANITGLPVGMTWQCNNFANGCNYDPSQSIYGCVNLSGTPLIAGVYNATVTVIATLQVLGDQTISYTLPFTVLPDTVSNPGFSMTNSSGCLPLSVTFVTNNPGQASYLWDFGNGIQSTLENPPIQTYNAPGDYVVTQTVTANGSPQYFLTDITVASIPDNYGAPVDVPDMYFYLYDSQGNQIYDSHPSVSNTNAPLSWTLPNIPLQNNNYTLHVWDEDGGLFGADDDLGSVTFPGWSASGTATGTLSGVSGSLVVNYSIMQVPVATAIHTDTVHVYAVPDTPMVSANIPLILCTGDTVVLTCNDTLQVQWYESGNLLIGETNSDLVVTASGNFSAVVTNAHGCTATSVTISVQVNPIRLTQSRVISGYMLQWYFNGSALTGETALQLTATQQGTYSVIATDSISGCSSVSDPLVFTPVGIDQLQSVISAILFPNPADKSVVVQLTSGRNVFTTVQLLDISGWLLQQKDFMLQQGSTQLPFDLTDTSKGLYLIKITQKNASKTLRLVISR